MPPDHKSLAVSSCQACLLLSHRGAYVIDQQAH
eukprot:COSAG04_NODE_30691_length_261_cov_0.641975_2_plen_32_part_01